MKTKTEKEELLPKNGLGTVSMEYYLGERA